MQFELFFPLNILQKWLHYGHVHQQLTESPYPQPNTKFDFAHVSPCLTK